MICWRDLITLFSFIIINDVAPKRPWFTDGSFWSGVQGGSKLGMTMEAFVHAISLDERFEWTCILNLGLQLLKALKVFQFIRTSSPTLTCYIVRRRSTACHFDWRWSRWVCFDEGKVYIPQIITFIHEMLTWEALSIICGRRGEFLNLYGSIVGLVLIDTPHSRGDLDRRAFGRHLTSILEHRNPYTLSVEMLQRLAGDPSEIEELMNDFASIKLPVTLFRVSTDEGAQASEGLQTLDGKRVIK
jgi:hypothetical protein